MTVQVPAKAARRTLSIEVVVLAPPPAILGVGGGHLQHLDFGLLEEAEQADAIAAVQLRTICLIGIPVATTSRSLRRSPSVHAPCLGGLHPPGAQARPFACAYQRAMGRLVERRAGQFVAAAADLADDVGLARLVAGRCQAEMGANVP